MPTERERLVHQGYEVIDDVGMAFKNRKLWGNNYCIIREQNGNGVYSTYRVVRLNVRVDIKPSKLEVAWKSYT